MPAHQCGEARWFYNERGGPYECRKTHTYAVCMCVCVCVCVCVTSPPPSLPHLVVSRPLYPSDRKWQQQHNGRRTHNSAKSCHSTNPVTSERLMKKCDRGAKGVRHGEERKKFSLQIFTRYDLQPT